MTTVVNNPASGNGGGDSGSGMGVGMVIGIIVVIAIIVLFFVFFGFGGQPTTQPESGNNGGVNLEIPDEIDVNVGGLEGGAPAPEGGE
jgi:hypothetical protein